MSEERSGATIFQGNPLTLVGPELKEGDAAPQVTLTGADLSAVSLGGRSADGGKVKLVITVPSVDTSVCSLESKKFSERAKTLDVDQVAVYVASADLPFALSRWCGAEGVDNLTMVSDHRSMDLANRWGLRIKEWHLLARAVYVLDRDNLGQLGTSADNIIQRLDNQVGAYATTTKSVQACFTSPAMWGQNVYFGGKYDVLKMFTLDPNTGLLSTTPVSQGTLAYGYPGGNPVISANGTANGIVWTIDSKTNALIASDATNLANTLFSGTLSVPVIRWTVPTVVNGHVYVGGQGMVFGFGLK